MLEKTQAEPSVRRRRGHEQEAESLCHCGGLQKGSERQVAEKPEGKGQVRLQVFHGEFILSSYKIALSSRISSLIRSCITVPAHTLAEIQKLLLRRAQTRDAQGQQKQNQRQTRRNKKTSRSWPVTPFPLLPSHSDPCSSHQVYNSTVMSGEKNHQKRTFSRHPLNWVEPQSPGRPQTGRSRTHLKAEPTSSPFSTL